ncbi:sulfatase-like hydrolase/transferase [Candidatus Hydrogenedentota bacterium]
MIDLLRVITTKAPRLLEKHRRFIRVTLTLAVVMFANEIYYNLAKSRDVKGAITVTENVSVALLELKWIIAGMVMKIFFVTVIVNSLWAAISIITCDAFTKKLTSLRGASFFFWLANLLGFYSAWYSFHHVLFPYSALLESPLCKALGLNWMFGQFPVSRLWLLPTIGGGLYVALTTFAALVLNRKFRKTVVISVPAIWILVGGYCLMTSPWAVKEFKNEENIILFGIDSFQLNRLPIGGLDRDISPNVNALLDRCYRFDNTWVSMARTYPSLLSLATGREPINHGIRYSLAGDSFLSDSNRYLAEIMRENGYYTLNGTDEVRFAAIRPKFGYDELLHPRIGVESFLLSAFSDFSASNLVRQFHLGDDFFPEIKNNRDTVAYNPRLWVDNLLKTLNNLPDDQPLFIQLHLCANHWPFTTPAPYAYMGRDPVESSIVMADRQVKDILEYLEESGLLDKSLTVVFSDHGDGWTPETAQEEIVNTHGNTFDHIWANKAVLGFLGHGIEPGVTNELVRMYDVYPTVLEMAGIEPVANIDGESLAPIMKFRETAPRKFFAETGVSVYTFPLVRQVLVDENIYLYTFDPETRLVTMTEKGLDNIFWLKSYMAIVGDKRLVTTPGLRKTGRMDKNGNTELESYVAFEMFAFDRDRGVDFEIQREFSNEEKLEMLFELADHFRLDRQSLLNAAIR